MSLLHAYGRPYHRVTKRALDLVLAAFAFVLAAPMVLTIMAAVRLSGPGPVFYRQVRVGEGGVPFQILKFRTMRRDAEVDGNAAWAGENDHRVTGIGRLLRRYRLDELPQILNVLRGEMSAVGPRPERPQFVSVLEREIPHWSRRLLVKPGLTGWAQVRMGYTADLASAGDKLAYDLFYIKHRGLMLDLAIILRTVRVVLRGSGAR
jgi:lipopolysaccharide/colanic/teichoic acid biosynthesis glycosyltransferase